MIISLIWCENKPSSRIVFKPVVAHCGNRGNKSSKKLFTMVNVLIAQSINKFEKSLKIEQILAGYRLTVINTMTKL